MALLFVTLFLAVSGWLAWQAGQVRAELARQRQVQTDLARSNHELSARKEKLQAREQIIARAAALGLYPPHPDQIRKLGTR